MLLVPGILVLLATCAKSKDDVDKLPLGFKGHGIMDLHKGDTALVLYVTVTNLGHDPLSLSLVGRSCCQEVAPGDVDCDSMLLIGGDMGDIYPGDSQNLTAFYSNLYLLDRVGYCELEIAVPDGEKLLHTVSFNTTIPRSGANVPSFLRDFVSAAELKSCRSPDQDPTRSCTPVLCDIKYNGVRNYFNETSQRCEPTANCWDDAEGEEMVYLAGSNSCRRLSEVLSAEDMEQFEKFQERETPLRSIHGYPIKVNCHKGRPDPADGWCLCDPGWESDPLDHDGFNPDLMVYHMCTVYSGVTTPDPSLETTVHRHRHTKKYFLANLPKKRRRGSPLEAGAQLMSQPAGHRGEVRGKWLWTGGAASGAANGAGGDDAGDEEAGGRASPWYSPYISDVAMKSVVLPVLIATFLLLIFLVVGLAVFVVMELHKVRAVSPPSRCST